MGENPPGLVFAPGSSETEEDPIAMACCRGELGVAPELVGEATEALGAVVVFEEEGKGAAGLVPDAVAVGTYYFAPLAGTAPFGPPLEEPAVGFGTGGTQQSGKEAVETRQVTESLAGCQVVD
jgi:hypothetical protein